MGRFGVGLVFREKELKDIGRDICNKYYKHKIIMLIILIIYSINT